MTDGITSVEGLADLDDFESPSFGEHVGCARADYERQFGVPPQWIAAAPGRVNLIGEHTDYNEGFVFPLAIERYVVVAGGRPKGGRAGKVRVHSTLMEEAEEFALDDLRPEQRDWTSYIRGVFAGFAERDLPSPALDMLIDSRVPLGGGLSSSAALEVATATLLEGVVGTRLDPIEKARLCQKAEHQFAGVPCGIMDQFSSALGEAGKLLLIDCRSETAELVPLDDSKTAVLVINSNVRHELTGGEYAERRSQCRAAAEALGAAALRDVSRKQLDAAAEQLEPLLLKRARHVVGEDERTLAAAEALRASDWDALGELMYASHDSLRDDYEVSCPELDLLVELSREHLGAGGVIGSRMTGGGFGGCTVTLVVDGKERQVASRICAAYRESTGAEATPFVTKPARGAHLVQR